MRAVDLFGARGEAHGADFERRAEAVDHDVVGGGVVDIDAHQGLDARPHLAVVVAHAPLSGHRGEIFHLARELHAIIERPDDADFDTASVRRQEDRCGRADRHQPILRHLAQQRGAKERREARALGLQARPEVRLALVEHHQLIGGDFVDARNLRDQILPAHEPVAEPPGYKLAEVVTSRSELLTHRNYRHRRSPGQARDYRRVK